MTDTAPLPQRSVRKAKGCGHLRRAELLAAAERLFHTQGYERATIRRIADDAGVSSTALYMYFTDKSQMLLEIGVNAAETLCATFEDIERRRQDPGDRVHDMLRALILFGREQRYAYQLLFCTAPAELEARRREACATLVGRCKGQLSSALGALRAQGRLRSNCPEMTAQGLWSACHGLVAFPLACPDYSQGPTEDIEALTVAGLLRGLTVELD